MLINNVGSIARRLQDEFHSTSSQLQHQGVKGGIREDALKHALRDLLPLKYSIGSGIVVDAYDTQSKQQDFVIYDGFGSPVFLKSESQVILPVESVYATTEIKSTINKGELEIAIGNVASIKKLQKSLFHPPGVNIVPSNFIYSSVFAYTSDVDIMTLKKRFDEMSRDIIFSQRISTICILDQGCIVNVHRDNMDTINTQPSEDTITVVRKLDMEQSLYMFYLMLQFHLSSNIVYPPDLIKYANSDRPFESSPISIDYETLKTMGCIRMDDFVMTFDDFQRYRRIQPYIGKCLSDDEATKAGFSKAEIQLEVKWGENWISRAQQARARDLQNKETK